MAATDAQDARTERRLRLGIRLVFYPLCLGLVALVWSHYYRNPAARAPEEAIRWVGATQQGVAVQAVTIGGVLTYFRTRIVTQCLNGETWTLRLTMLRGEFNRSGDIVHGRQGPTRTTSDQGEPVIVVTRVRTQMYYNPLGTFRSEVTRRPGARSVHCSSHELTYTLHRATDR